MISGQGSHFAQGNAGKKKKKGRGRHRLAPPAAKPAAMDESPAQVRSSVADAYGKGKAPVEKPRPLSFSKGQNAPAGNGSSTHARGPSDPLSVSRASTNLANSPPSPSWSAEDSKIGVHNDQNAASKAAASAAFFGKKDSHKEQAHPPLSSMRATETPRRDSSTLGAAYRTEGPTIGAFPEGDVAEVAENGPAAGKNEAVDMAEEEEEYNEKELGNEVVRDTAGAGAVESNQAVSGVKEENEWVKEETDETPEHTTHTTQRHSEVTEYLPESAVGVSGKQIERKIEKDTIEKEVIEKPVDKEVSENVSKREQRPSYAAMVAKPREPSPTPPAAVASVAPEDKPAPTAPPKVSPPPTPAQAQAPDTAPAPAAAPVPIPAPIAVSPMKQEAPAMAEKAEQVEVPAKQEELPATTSLKQDEPSTTTNQEAVPTRNQEVPTAESLGVAAPAVPVKAPERLVPTDPVVPGKVPALASADDQVKAAVASSSAIKSPTNKETVRKQNEAQASQLTRQQKKEIEKEEKSRAKQKAKEQKARDKEFKESQKHLRKGSTSPLPLGKGGKKRLRLRDRIMNRIARLMSS